MGINYPIVWELIDQVMEVNYNRNTSLALEADLTLFVVDADVSVKMWSCLDPYEA